MDHQQFAFAPGTEIVLGDLPTSTSGASRDEEDAQESIKRSAAEFVRYQDFLMAHEQYGLLILFQGMDASGKDEAIQHVLAGFDPRGVEFKQFKRMTAKEIRHDYLWRAVAALPARGQIGIFNRSYYEHVAAERVHPEQLDKANLPAYAREDVWNKRYRHINHFEAYLYDNGIHLLKFYLHVSRDEQRRRLLERIDAPETCWQFSQADVEERAHWDEYLAAYSQALTHTNTESAPWYVIPADRPWCARAAVSLIVLNKLKSLHTAYPEMDDEQQEILRQARETLEWERT